MNKLYYIGIDAHKNTCFLSCYDREENKEISALEVKTNVPAITAFIQGLTEILGDEAQFKLGYESGCLGTWLAEDLITAGYACDVMATSTIAVSPQSGIKKNDYNDAQRLAKALAWNEYKPVALMDMEDRQNRDFMRYRQDRVDELKRAKQQMNAFLLTRNKSYTEGTKWTQKHFKWLHMLSNSLSGMEKEIFDNRLMDIEKLKEEIDRLDQRASELAQEERYQKNARNLQCFKGISTIITMTLLTETGDFTRFPTARKYSGYGGFIPTENSSAEHQRHGAMNKAGNKAIRTALIEATQALVKGYPGSKGKALLQRQKGCPREVVEYADMAVKRLQTRFQLMIARYMGPGSEDITGESGMVTYIGYKKDQVHEDETVLDPDRWEIPEDSLDHAVWIEVVNAPGGIELPETGGFGTFWTKTAGMMLVAASLGGLWRNGKSKKERVYAKGQH